MNRLIKIIYNCRQATFLIEKKQLTELTTKEKMELRIHLAGCSICKIFQRQSILINGMIKKRVQLDTESQTELDEDFKIALQEKIDQQLNQN
ncbi:hypothetical protein [Pedobacter foliorum]|uniref:hypothetical protein n=1 Tax=Pedobacter foliorum TaxID=2739058 RepID=UPI00156500EB|nr:hypothetical protein [Pedobacter foliorum]NRF37658.1 hypothetical protein [Pedobacter foliorum]